MKNTMRKAMLSTIAMLVVAVMSLTGVTYAWFTAGDTAKVSGMSMQVVTADGGLEVSSDGENWKTTLDLGLDPKASVDPVSTVGATSFVMLDKYNPTNSAEAMFKTADAGDVITQTLYLGNSGTTALTVDLRGTYVADIENASTAAKTKTNIADAARIAIFTVAEGGGKTLVGIMNPYKDAAGTITDTAETYNGIETTNSYITFGAASGTGLSSITTKTTNGLEVTVPAADAQGNRGELQIEVVVWLEGQDAKCINANAGGAFEIYLQFNKTDAVLATN